ncbi:uncharacterized protein At4g08330, chloroplastic-like [Panicum virgatum]|uniref:Yippee domain-containing protein n=1 Tax=Panicum virgatum TaxID=38727 RepID=A0A8T0R4M1_PANVG|nr:uncharacterized protein At4g08330, chloroplastic-like [Panicum virgatum]KAG2580058.1 hypothetical protein PVAP13_6NG298437 [Panicum virgatum]
MDQPMDMEMEKKDASSALQRSLSAVTYYCGACGYDLRLRSSDRNTAGIVGGRYGRAARRGVVAFDAIDDARFGHTDEFRCVDVRARRLFVRRTRLLCRKCGATLGFGYDDRGRGADGSKSPRYDIRIHALQPLADADDGDGTAA